MQDPLAKAFGTPTSRIDGVAKVTGAARFASDDPVANPAFAYLVTSSIARGRIDGFSLDSAQAVPGVLNPLGIKGIGEIGIVGMNAAVANAVFNATGKRIRSLPIRAEKLL
jgi:CO/xanthine dehydrogenase Mo-binding subunit